MHLLKQKWCSESVSARNKGRQGHILICLSILIEYRTLYWLVKKSQSLMPSTVLTIFFFCFLLTRPSTCNGLKTFLKELFTEFVFCENMLWACTVQGCLGIFLAGKAAKDSGGLFADMEQLPPLFSISQNLAKDQALTDLPLVVALLLIERFHNYTMKLESWLSIHSILSYPDFANR